MRRLVNHKLVDELPRQQVAGNGWPGFDKHVVDFAGREIGENGGRVHVCVVCLHLDDVGTGINEWLPSGVVGAIKDCVSGQVQHAGRHRHAQAGIQNGTQWLPAGGIQILVPDVQCGVIRKYGANAGEDSARPGTQALHVSAGFRPGNPLTLARCHCNRTVEARADDESAR